MLSVAPVATEGHEEACGLGRQLAAMLVSKAHAAMGVMQIWMAYTATWNHGNILTQAAAKDCV